MKYRKSGLLLSPMVFESLYSKLIDKFELKYRISVSNLMDYQLFGYGNYDRTQPNLKQFILEETGSSLNGKYLYNKYLEWSKGKSTIKLTREFSYTYFNAIGYKHIADFLKNAGLSPQKIKEQKSIEVITNSKPIDEYFLGYSQNEEGQITKSKLIISRQKLTVKWILGYMGNGKLSEYVYLGDVKYQENGMSFFFENNKNELDRSLFIGFYFDRRVKIIPYLIGTFAGFDRERKPVIGIVLFERKNDISELEVEFKNQIIDKRITQFIVNKRWSTAGTMPQRLDDLPKQKPIPNNEKKVKSHIIHDTLFYFHGTFKIFFQDQLGGSSSFSLQIDELGNVLLENDSFKYSGRAFISEGAILSIQITQCNQVPHGAQLLAFIGRYPKDQIIWFKGTWHGLDETLTPSTRQIVFINDTYKVSDVQLESIQKSKKKLTISS